MIKKVIVVLCALMSILSNAYSNKHPQGYAIASASRYATEAGMKILRKGGNAFDAAITVTSVLAVVEPYHSGLGGGGFWLLHDEKKHRNVFVDGREQAPSAASSKLYLDASGNFIKGSSLFGPKAAAIPGEPKVLDYLAHEHGKLPLKETLAPAIKLARNGFRVDHNYIHYVSIPRVLYHLRQYPSSRNTFLVNGKIPEVGYLLKQPALANTLETIANQGAKGFYSGAIAKSLVKSVQKYGGIWTLKDLNDYTLKIRAPLVGQFHKTTIVTAPPPSAGGVALLTMLKIIEAYPLHKLMPIQKIHYLVEAMRLAYWERSRYLGDPDFVSIPLKRLLSEKHIRQLRHYIYPDKATPSSHLEQTPIPRKRENLNTTHFSIIDADGNMVSATMSINFIFGSTFVAGDTGVLLNDEMDDFSIKPQGHNLFGLTVNPSNQIEPKKRPLSSMTPTFLISKDRVGILGTPGGSRIPTMIFLSTLSYLEGQGPLSWVSLPRFHHQYLPDKLEFENDALSFSMRKSLKRMGYQLKRIRRTYGGLSYTYGNMQALEWDKKEQQLYAASDPRQTGLAAVRQNNEEADYN